MQSALEAAFAPTALDIMDQSHAHAGHGGARPEGETHFHVRMVSARFAGRTRVQRQRAVMDALAGEFASGLHALSMDLRAEE